MVELLVVIGVIMVVLGLALPAITASREQARATTDLAVLRAHGAAVSRFASHSDDQFPLASDRRCGASAEWYRPLIASGEYASIDEVDPHSYPRWGSVTFHLSQSLVAARSEFEWGLTRDCKVSPSSAVRQADVMFPSQKGMLVKAFEREGRTPGDRWFCCADLWKAPVVFCDGSGEIGSFLEYSRGNRPVVKWEHAVGFPVLSPWGGYGARDR